MCLYFSIAKVSACGSELSSSLPHLTEWLLSHAASFFFQAQVPCNSNYQMKPSEASYKPEYPNTIG